MLIKDARIIWNQLKGIICVYKPADMKLQHVRKVIVNKVCTELNDMECRPPINYVSIEGDDITRELEVKVLPSLADDPQVVGPRYHPDDLPCSWSNYLGSNTSVLGLRTGTSTSKRIRENRPTRAYRVKGILGQATDNCFKDGKVVERSTFRHIRIANMERLLANMQAAHQKKMFELCGVDMQSQTAYELAIQGPIRPSTSKIPVIYGIKCVEFNPPEFTLEIQCVNEYESYLKTLIYEIGVKLHSTAHCIGIQCIRHSYFTLDHALLRRQWNLQNIVTNMENCERIMDQHESILNQQSVALL